MTLESAQDPILHIQMFQPCEKAHKATGRIGKLTLRLSAIIGDFILMADLVLLALGLGETVSWELGCISFEAARVTERFNSQVHSHSSTLLFGEAPKVHLP